MGSVFIWKVLRRRLSYCYSVLSKAYDVQLVEQKWRQIWSHGEPSVSRRLPIADLAAHTEKQIILAMFPYPSGKLHMGHVRVYTITDCLSRWRRMQGIKVMQPMGWDAFGLPAENAAMTHGINPSDWTEKNIAIMKDQMNSLCLDIDWGQEVRTCDESYYKWTQWIFLKLFKANLAYQANGMVNWDPVDRTVLANEQVDKNGRSWRSGALVEKKQLKQWYFKITSYADALHRDIQLLNGWPQKVKEMQLNWIGKSSGMTILFQLYHSKDLKSITVFTTRPETIYEATFIAVSLNHALLDSDLIVPHKRAEIRRFILETQMRLKKDPTTTYNEKVDGMDTGIKVMHPLSKDYLLPVYVVNYISPDDVSDAIMGIPAHPSSDELARKYNIVTVSPLSRKRTDQKEWKTLSSSSDETAIELERMNVAKRDTRYHLRDWLLSRQRYWGAPIPIIYCESCGVVPVPESQLPVKLPQINFSDWSRMNGNPLSSLTEWHRVHCPQCGGQAKRETDTMDTFVDSSWYFLRFVSPFFQGGLCNEELAKAWLPIHTYIGGMEHANSHLLYARFIYKFLRDIHAIPKELPQEPFTNLITQGMVHGRTFKCPDTEAYLKPSELTGLDDSTSTVPWIKATNKPANVTWEKMSKSKYNGVEPQSMLEKYGIDIVRLYILAKAPPDMVLDWNERDIVGQQRWTRKLWRLVKTYLEESEASAVDNDIITMDDSLYITIQQTIKDVSSSLEKNAFHNAISFLIKFVNELSDCPKGIKGRRLALETICKLLYPFAPIISSELWSLLGHESIEHESWPTVMTTVKEESKKHSMDINIQVNGKFKAKIKLKDESMDGSDKEDLIEYIKEFPIIKKFLTGKSIKNIILIRNKAINFITE